jgi:hypothetical protein
VLRLYLLLDQAGAYPIVTERPLDGVLPGSLWFVAEYRDDEQGAARLGHDLDQLRLGLCRRIGGLPE